ncbi:MAG: calcium-binding protein [Hyphomicrobiaceae bacterium]|nr:calcium-binding protein [Hyphomicrobiaceae bacterium]
MATISNNTGGSDRRSAPALENNLFEGFGLGADSLTGGKMADIFRMGALDGLVDVVDGSVGTDTIDYSLLASTVEITFGEGTTLGTVKAIVSPNSSIPIVAARLQSIENAIGSSGNDTITGNSANNELSGGRGNDTIVGGGGNDTISGGFGNDSLEGSAGTDTVSYAYYNDGGIEVHLSDRLFNSATSPIVSGFANQIVEVGADPVEDGSINGFENVIGSNNRDIIKGNHELNVLDGGGADDVLLSRIDGFRDTIIGGNGNDTIDYSGWSSNGIGYTLDIRLGEGAAAGATTRPLTDLPAGLVEDVLIGIENVTGTAGADFIVGNSGANILKGGDQADTITGGDGADTINGDAGGDYLRSLLDRDRDTINGGINFDTLQLDAGNADLAGSVMVRLGEGAQAGFVSAEHVLFRFTNPFTGDVTQSTVHVVEDDLINIEHVTGTARNDDIGGNGLTNLLRGEGGNDRLDGAGGNDTLVGGLGADTLLGGSGSDLFLFDLGDSSLSVMDIIQGFEVGSDILSLVGLRDNVADGASLHRVSALTGEAGEIVIFNSGGGSLLHVELDGVAAPDFSVFVAGVAPGQLSGNLQL